MLSTRIKAILKDNNIILDVDKVIASSFVLYGEEYQMMMNKALLICGGNSNV